MSTVDAIPEAVYVLAAMIALTCVFFGPSPRARR